MTTRKNKSLATKSAELAIAVPQVIAHRLTRMAIAGPVMSERDRKEFDLMVAEKQAAFTQAWQAMATQAFAANQALALSAFRAAWLPSTWGKPASRKIAAQVQSAAMGVLGKGLSPIHQKAVANAKRLARTKLR